MEGRKRNRTAVFAAFLAGIMLAGCGGSKTPSVDEGMAAVESLDYNTALQCFDKAMVEGEDLRFFLRSQDRQGTMAKSISEGLTGVQ